MLGAGGKGVGLAGRDDDAGFFGLHDAVDNLVDLVGRVAKRGGEAGELDVLVGVVLQGAEDCGHLGALRGVGGGLGTHGSVEELDVGGFGGVGVVLGGGGFRVGRVGGVRCTVFACACGQRDGENADGEGCEDTTLHLGTP